MDKNLIHTLIFIVVLFIKANVWKTQAFSNKECINNLWHYSDNLHLHNSQNNELEVFVPIQMNFTNTMLNKKLSCGRINRE